LNGAPGLDPTGCWSLARGFDYTIGGGKDKTGRRRDWARSFIPDGLASFD